MKKKWLVMDFGQVMVRFNPKEIAAPFVENSEDLKILTDVLFDRLYWDRLDAGTIEDSELITAVRARLPKRLWAAADKAYSAWIYSLPEIPGMRAVVERIKNKFGLRAALLSNISRGFAEKADDIEILSLFDVKIYSALCGFTKPSREIFALLCKTCEAEPKDLIFVDDSEKNVNGARDFGIDAVLFDGDSDKLEETLTSLLEN